MDNVENMVQWGDGERRCGANSYLAPDLVQIASGCEEPADVVFNVGRLVDGRATELGFSTHVWL